MKKTWLVLFMVIASTFLLSACSLFGGDKDDVVFESNVQEKRVGVLKSLGGMSVGEGTHILELEDQSTIRLKSSNIDLNNEKYISQKVEIRGPIAKTKDGKDLMDVKSIDIAEDEEEENVVEAQDKEYINANLGIRLVYKDSWNIEEESERIVFTAPKNAKPEGDSNENENENEDIVIIERIPNPQKKTLEAFLQIPSDTTNLMTLGYSQTLVGTDQLEGLKKEANNRYEIDIWLTRENYVYQLTFMGSENPDVSENRNVFFSMISSFRFIGINSEEEEEGSEETPESVETQTPDEVQIEQPSLEGYSQFESSPYKFVGQYPAGWYFSGSRGETENVLHHYGFSDKPLDEGGVELVSVDVVSGTLPSGTPIKVGDNSGVKVYESGKMAIYITRTSGTLYKIHGDSTQESKIINMAASIKPVEQ